MWFMSAGRQAHGNSMSAASTHGIDSIGEKVK
jgi:hypothetical protein